MFLAPSSSRAVDPYLQPVLLRVSLSRLGGKTPTAGAPGRGFGEFIGEFDGQLQTSVVPDEAQRSSSALGSPSPTDRAASKAAQSTEILQKFQKPQNNANSTNSLINSKKSEFRTSTTKPEFNPIKAKTLSELEEDLKKLLEDSKQETSINGKNHTLQFRPRHQAKSSEKSQGLASRKLPAKRSCQKTLF